MDINDEATIVCNNFKNGFFRTGYKILITDGAILGSAEFVHGFVGAWQRERERKYPPKVSQMRGTDWGDLAVIQGLRRQVFG